MSDNQPDVPKAVTHLHAAQVLLSAARSTETAHSAAWLRLLAIEGQIGEALDALGEL